MSKSSWREYANKVIVEVISANPEADEQALRKLIRDAYPWGQRAMHPYKIWCSAVRENLFKYRKIGSGKKDKTEAMGQLNLFK